jgi:hypothetical protein
MDTSTVVMMAAAVVTLVVVHWKSPQAAGDAVSLFFPFFAGWLSELVWGKMNS